MRNSARTLAALRKHGYHAEVCEKYITRPQGKGQAAKFAGGYRKDLFGFLDVISFHPSLAGVLGVQVTSRQQVSAHLKNYRRDPNIAGLIQDWIRSGNRFHIHGWRKLQVPCKGNPEKTKVRWELTDNAVSIEELIPNDRDLVWMREQNQIAIKREQEHNSRKAGATP